jgi:peptidoglycan-associated lipoprotein
MNTWTKFILIGCSILTLAACSSHRKPTSSDIHAANSAYGTRASGLGSDGDFGDDSSGGGHRLANKNTYYFDYDSNAVHGNDRPAIEANARYAASHAGTKVVLEGNTDPRGSREYNIGLGERRGQSVASLMASQGVKPSQIRVVSYGAERRAAEGHSEDAYRLDRRVNLQFSKR